MSFPYYNKVEEEVRPRDEVDFLRDLGMTYNEAFALIAIGKAADACITVLLEDEQHPADMEEVAAAIHQIQNWLMSRPFYKRYKSEER